LESHFAGNAGNGTTLTNTAPRGHLYTPGVVNPILGMPITNLQAAAKETPMASHLSHLLLRGKLAPTECTAPTVRAIMRQMTNAAPSGKTDSIVIGSMWNMKRYALADTKVLIDLISHPFMSSINNENWADSGLRDMISFFSFNANKNYLYTETFFFFFK
jgi:hypothetical protein